MPQDNPRLEFEPIEHKYSLVYQDGAIERIPSVSEIIEPLVDYSMVDKATMARACEFGTNVHKSIELWLKGTLDIDKLDDGLKKPLEGFRKWLWSTYQNAKCQSEVRMHHEPLGYAGTIDLIVGDDTIIDIKTRKYNRVVDPVRLGAYSLLTRGYHTYAYVLEIDVDGNCKLINAYDKYAKSVFRKLLDRYNREQEFNDFVRKWKGK